MSLQFDNILSGSRVVSLLEKATVPAGEWLASRNDFLSRMVLQTFNGYCVNRLWDTEQDMRNHGSVRVKHAVRRFGWPLSGADALPKGCIPVRVETQIGLWT
jgi:hypothetical protein